MTLRQAGWLMSIIPVLQRLKQANTGNTVKFGLPNDTLSQKKKKIKPEARKMAQ